MNDDHDDYVLATAAGVLFGMFLARVFLYLGGY